MNTLRTLTCLAALALALGASAQNKTFIAVSKTGDCSIQQGKDWPALKVGTQLTEKSVLRNSGQPEAEIQLIGMETGESYKVFILHSQFEMSSLFNNPVQDYSKGSGSSYVHYVLQTALEAGSDTHFVRNFTGVTHRADSLLIVEDVDKILYSIARGDVFLIDNLKSFRSDYPVSAEVIPGGVILDNEADIPLYFILYTVENSDDGPVLNAVFTDDVVISIPPKTQVFREAGVNADAGLLLFAYDVKMDPITVKRAITNAEGGVPQPRDTVKIGVFSKF